MALDVLIGGANLDAGGNTKVALPDATTPARVGAVRVFSENDPGTITGTAYLKSPETSPDYRIRTGVDTELFRDTFNWASQNTNLWSYVFATLTCTQPGTGYLQFGTVQGTAGTHGAHMRTFQYFPLLNTGPLAVEFVVTQATAVLAADEVWHMGFGLPGSAILKPTDGVYWQITSAGIEGIIAFNGTYTSTGVLLPLNALNLNDYDKFTIVIGEREVEWWHKDVLLQEQAIPVAQGIAMIAPAQPIFMQKYCTGVVANTNVMRVQRVGVTTMDLEIDRSWQHSRAIAGQSAYVGQNGHTMGTTQFVGTITTGSTPILPTAAAGSNTAANAVGIGGTGAFSTLAGAATDFIATSFQNPAATVNITGRNLVICGVKIATVNIGAAVATTPTTLLWALAFGHNSVTMNTTESASFATATAHAPRRILLGYQSAAIGTVVGGLYAPEINFDFTAPVVIRPGEFIATLMKVIVGTATASQVINYCVTFDAYYE
jgi:hypothetical protein